MPVTCGFELKVIFQYAALLFLSVTVIVHGLILPCRPKDIPVYIWNNCSYQCNIITSFNTLVALCQDDQKTLLTCEDGFCAKGTCRTATCLCLEADECIQCQAIAHFCTERKPQNETRKEITTTSNYNEWWLDQQNKNKEKEKSSGSFSWKTFVLIVALFVICMIILLTVEKLSGVKFRDIIRGTTTSTRRPPTFDMQPATAPAAAIHVVPEQQYLRVNLPAHQNRASHIQPPPDLPPSYDIALAITDPPPSYIEVNKKSDIMR